MSIADLLDGGRSEFPPNKFYGITVAIVTDIDDPDKLGRVKVKLLNRDNSEHETDFIRVMTPMTGKQWGMFFFPEVGDEVVVAFSNGEISRPYVLGSLWNEQYKPPVEIKDKKNVVREIKTKNGHEIIFNDEEDNDFIKIITPKKLEINLDDKNEVIFVKDKDKKNYIKIDSKSGIVTVEAEKTVNVIAGNSKMVLDGNAQSVTIESSQSIKMSAQQITINSGGTLDLKATGNLNIKSDGPVNVKGAVAKIN